MSNKYAHLAPSRTSKKKAIFAAVRGAANACLHKTPFDSQAMAETRAAQITAEGKPMRCYHCPHCHAWHLARLHMEAKPAGGGR